MAITAWLRKEEKFPLLSADPDDPKSDRFVSGACDTVLFRMP